MKPWLIVPLAVVGLGCSSGSSSKQEVQTTNYEIHLQTTPYDLRPGGYGKAMTVQVVQQPGGQVVDLSAWPTGTWRWELVGAPSGVDGGQFATPAFGHFSDRVIPPDFPQMKTVLSQVYYTPASLPQGTTRLEMKIRITITPPGSLSGGPVAQAETPVAVDVNAPALAPPPAEGQKNRPGLDGVK